MAEESGRRRTGVQSLGRAFDVLERLADAGGTASLTRLAADSGLPLPTIHRLVRTLVDLGYVRQEPNREYSLGARLVRLGEAGARGLRAGAQPLLVGLADELGESANLAVLDGDEVAYVAHAPSRRSMRMFTEVGRRVLPHCTAVGKAMLADEDDDRVRALLARTGMPAATERTVTDPETLLAELAQVRSRGWALDDGEQEPGVRCVAVAVPGATTPLAMSVSGPTDRMGADTVERVVPLLTDAARRLARTLGPSPTDA